MFSHDHNHKFSSDNFEAIHLNLDANIHFYLYPDKERSIINCPIAVTVNIDDFLVIINSKFGKTFELVNTEDKTNFKFESVNQNYKVSSKYLLIYPNKSKIDVVVNFDFDKFKEFIKIVYSQMIEVYTFYHSCIDWDKNEEESKKANALKKQIEKMSKMVQKL